MEARLRRVMRANRQRRGGENPGHSGAGRPSIELHIEELVLHGFAPGDRHRIGDAVERELIRLLEGRGLVTPFETAMAMERIDAGSVSVRPGAPVETVGRETARALHRGLGAFPRTR